jgi:hypothetical protein
VNGNDGARWRAADGEARWRTGNDVEDTMVKASKLHAARRVRAIAVGVLLPLAACDEDPIRVQVTQQRDALPGLLAQVVAPQTAVVGTQVNIGLRLENRGATTLTIPLLGVGQQFAFDVQIFAADGTLVWQHVPAGQLPPTTVTQLTLAPGGIFVLPTVWDMRLGAGFVAPGTYTIRARVLTPTGEIVAAPGGIVVSP